MLLLSLSTWYFFCWMGRGDHPKTFLPKELFYLCTPWWLKVVGGWVGGGGLVDFTVISWDWGYSPFPFPIPHSQAPITVPKPRPSRLTISYFRSNKTFFWQFQFNLYTYYIHTYIWCIFLLPNPQPKNVQQMLTHAPPHVQCTSHPAGCETRRFYTNHSSPLQHQIFLYFNVIFVWGSAILLLALPVSPYSIAQVCRLFTGSMGVNPTLYPASVTSVCKLLSVFSWT